ncbi:MAG: OmpA family protein [Gammaproteobacteria bacterium]|nr:OmpA family protein [Gammaproteobacteria bacterium]
MKLKTLAQVVLVSCAILGLTACSSMKKHGDQSGVTDANASGSQTYGAGDSSNFGGGNLTPEQLLAKKTYYFEFDKADISDNDRPAIVANANHLVANSRAKVLLEGHTDPRGSREYNVALGERRANAVANLMKSKGVNPDQVRVISYGAERLAATGRTEQDYQRDRRVVLVSLQQ